MPALPSSVYLPLTFNQLLDLVKQLPEYEKQKLADFLVQEEAAIYVSEQQQQLVSKRVKKYKYHPELLINEAETVKNNK